MKRDFLKNLGIADDVIDKIMDENGKDINTSRAEMDAITKERDTYKGTVGDYEKQLAELKKSAGDNEALTTKIAELQAANKKAAQDIIQLKLDSAVELGLANAKAKDPKAVRGVLDMSKIKLNDKNEVEGLAEQLKDLQKTHDYLFETSGQAAPKGMTPAGGSDSVPNGVTKEQFNRMGYRERLKLHNDDPETYKAMTEKE
jgi:hypothetical protein